MRRGLHHVAHEKGDTRTAGASWHQDVTRPEEGLQGVRVILAFAARAHVGTLVFFAVSEWFCGESERDVLCGLND